MIYMRGQSKDYDHWRQLGNIGWSWDDVSTLLCIKTEDNFSGTDEYPRSKEENGVLMNKDYIGMF